MSATALISVHLFLGLFVRTLYIYGDGDYPQGDILAPWVLQFQDYPLIEVSAFFLVYAAAIFFGGVYGKRSSVFASRVTGIDSLSPRAMTLLWLVLIFSLTIFFLAAALQFGGVSAYFTILAARVSESVEGFGYYAIFSDVAVVASLFIFWCREAAKSSLTRRAAQILPIFIVTLLFLQGGRGNLIQYVLSLMLIYRFSLKSKTKSNLALLIVPPVVVVVAVVGLSYRLAAQYELTYDEAQAEAGRNVAGAVLAPFALLDHLMLSQVYVDKIGLDYGAQYLSNITKAIPRSMWPEKPKPQAIMMREVFWGDSLGGIPPGYIGEAYIAFGLVGVIVASALLGWIGVVLNAYYRLCEFNRVEKYSLFYAIIVPYVAFNLVRGGVDIAFTRMAVVLFSYFMIKKLIASSR